MIENRKFIRLKAPLPVDYRLIKKHKRQRTQNGFMYNISVGGLSMKLGEAVRQGQMVQLSIQIPHLEDSVDAIGDVVWYTSVRNRETSALEHRAGIRFREVDPSQLNMILDYVYSIAIG